MNRDVPTGPSQPTERSKAAGGSAEALHVGARRGDMGTGTDTGEDTDVVFDLDGVLLDSESDLSWLDRALSRTLSTFEIPATPANKELLFPWNVRDVDAVGARLGVEPQDLWTVRNDYYIEEKVTAIEAGEMTPFPDVDQLYRLGNRKPSIISNSPQEVVDAFIDVYGYDDLFRTGIGRGSTLEALETLKPDPHMYNRLIDEVGPGEYAYVGDTETDRAFAENTGMAFVHLTRDDRGCMDLSEALDRLRSRGGSRR